MAVGFLPYYVCIWGRCGMGAGEGRAVHSWPDPSAPANQANSKAGTATGMLRPGRMLGLSVGQAWSGQPYSRHHSETPSVTSPQA